MSVTNKPSLYDILYPPPFFGLFGGFYTKRLTFELIEGTKGIWKGLGTNILERIT